MALHDITLHYVASLGVDTKAPQCSSGMNRVILGHTPIPGFRYTSNPTTTSFRHMKHKTCKHNTHNTHQCCHVSESWGAVVESQQVTRRSDTEEVTVGERPPSLSHTPRTLSSCLSIRCKTNRWTHPLFSIQGYIHQFF